MNYAELDKKINFHYPDDLYSRLEGTGSRYVSEYLYKSYQIDKFSTPVIGKTLGVTEAAVRYWARQWGFKLRSKGGNICNRDLLKPEVRDKIMSLKGVINAVAAAKLVGVCHDSTVRAMWKRGY